MLAPNSKCHIVCRQGWPVIAIDLYIGPMAPAVIRKTIDYSLRRVNKIQWLGSSGIMNIS